MAQRVWCNYESDWFDSDEFEDTAQYGQVHERAGTQRHTTSGLVIEEGAERAPWETPW
jgi:hypothetical protein